MPQGLGTDGNKSGSRGRLLVPVQAFGYRIKAAGMKGVTFENAAKRQPTSAEEAKTLDGGKGIGRTGWIETALGRKQRGDTALIEANQK